MDFFFTDLVKMPCLRSCRARQRSGGRQYFSRGRASVSVRPPPYKNNAICCHFFLDLTLGDEGLVSRYAADFLETDEATGAFAQCRLPEIVEARLAGYLIQCQ